MSSPLSETNANRNITSPYADNINSTNQSAAPSTMNFTGSSLNTTESNLKINEESLVAKATLIKTLSVELFSESFGSVKNPAMLLIMGSGCQGLFWPKEFCETLAKKGLYVIRYDNRDTGRTTYTNNVQTAYTIKEMSEDALAVLDGHHVSKAHLVGFSMGGEIAQFIGGNHSDCALSLTLISSSTTVVPFFNALANKTDRNGLSAPKKEYVDWLLLQKPDPTDLLLSEKIDKFMQRWRLLSGNESTFNEGFFRKLAEENFIYAKGNSYPNHSLAMKASIDDHTAVTKKIRAPTVIIVGTAEPLFAQDHARALQETIPETKEWGKPKVVVVQKMGHAIVPDFYQDIINAILMNPILG